MIHAIEEQLSINNVKHLSKCVVDSDQGKLFLKTGESELVVGELESLKAIQSTHTILCPKPYGIVKVNGTNALVTSFIEFQHGKDWAKAGKNLAKMHAKNVDCIQERKRLSSWISSNSAESDESDYGDHNGTDQFGFHVPTCCGRIPQINDWAEDWTKFFICNRLKPQLDRLIENRNAKELVELSELLYRKTEKLLETRKCIAPSLVHGDLWGGNWSMCNANSDTMEPIVFDPSASYSDPEFEFGIMKMFGGWTQEFEEEYDKIMGSSEGRHQRVMLYELYHNLNHWNHFGGSYRDSSLNIIRNII